MVVQDGTSRIWFLKSSPNNFIDYEKGKGARRILTRCPLLGAVGWRKPQVNPVSRSQEQSSRDPPKEWPSFRHLSKWFTQQVEACSSPCDFLPKRSLAEAEWASCTARHISAYQEQYYRLPPSALACHRGTGADVWPAQLQGQRWPTGADCFGEADLLLRGNYLFCIEMMHLHVIRTHNGDSLSLGFWILVKFGLPLARHPKS